MTVIIGIDPHKVSHAACAIDNNEQELAQLQCGPGNVNSTSSSVGRNRSRSEGGRSSPPAGLVISLPNSSWVPVSVWWTCPRRCRRGCGSSGRVVRIRTTRTMRGRSRSWRCGHASLAVVRPEDHVTVLRLLAKAHLDAGRARSRACCRLHALARELVVGGIRKEVVVSQAETLLAVIEPTGAAQRQRLELAHELLDEIRALDATLKRSKRRITDAIVASGTTVTDLYGVGPIVAAIIIGYSGDVCRFSTAGHYASYNGTAPIELSSAGRTVHRLSRRGNRTLNHAIHMAAVTQIRNPDSEGRGYYDTKLAAGKTKREAMRALKRRISDRVYRQLVADIRR